MQESERAGILYYARERQYKHVYADVLELIRRHGAEPVLVFWKAYSLVMEGRASEGMREAEPVQDSKDVSLCSKMLLLYAHKQCKIVDREAVQQLEAKIRSERMSSGEQALYYASFFLWVTGRVDKSREYADRLLKIAPDSAPGLALRGWIDLTCGRDVLMKKSIKFFEEAMAAHTQQSALLPPPVDVIFGRSRYYYLRHNFSHALEHANLAVASYPKFLPALVEKMKVLLALQDWEQAVDTAQRCLSHDVSCVEAYRVLILELLAQNGDCQEAATMLGDLTAQLDQFEPHTHWLYHEVALSPARLAGGNSLVLQQTMTLVERAVSLAPHSSVYINELAYQQLLCGKVSDSLATYKKAFAADETSVEALAGVIHCQLVSGQVTEAEQQLEFLAEVQSSIGKQANILYLNAVLAQEKGQPEKEVMELLQEARDISVRGLKGQPLNSRYFEFYNPEFLLWIVHALLVYAPTEPASTPAQAHPSLSSAASILDTLLKLAPALTAALLLLTRVRFLSGDVQASQTYLQKCIKLDPNSTEAHLLMAQIQLHLENPQQSRSSLEMALSRSFEVKSFPRYHLISGRVHRALGSMTEAHTSLDTALKMCTAKRKEGGSQKSVAVGGRGGGRRGGGELGASEVATVYLELVAVLIKLGKQHEATKVMQDAINHFSGTSEEFRISVAHADLLMEKSDTEQALALLKTVTEDKPYFVQAREKMAAIYLTQRKDRRLYIACFTELAEKQPGSATALLLGDAYMNIQEPEQALVVYERALKKTPRDSVLASKVGQALVKTHHYTKAISYYEAALKSERMQFLRSDLAELYLKLKQFDRAEKTVNTALGHKEEIIMMYSEVVKGKCQTGSGEIHGNGSQLNLPDMKRMCENTDLLLLLARVREKAGKQGEALLALEQAREMQAKVLKRASVDQPDSVADHKKKASDIACLLAKANTHIDDVTRGLQYYREALLYCDTDCTTRLALAELLLASGDVEQCEEECEAVLRTDPANQGAEMLIADVMFRKGNYEKAVEHYQNLLGRKADNFPALANTIEMFRRTGRLADASQYVDQAHSVCSKPTINPGLTYCRGLLKWYENSASEALQLFNQVRRDGEWGQKALVNMVEICLNPDNDILGGETLRAGEREGSSQEEHTAAIKTAQKLLKEAGPNTLSEEVRVHQLENMVLLATKTRGNVEQALGRFMEMAASSKDNVTALLGVATAHIILKQTPRARNQLKRIAKMPWTAQEAESFERGWLLLAEVYIQAGKYDMALELLKKCLRYNQGCCKAWEYHGFISEKEQAYKDAASHYEKAWRYSNHANPAIGYKLAFNYLKAKRLVEAIQVCHTVLCKHPRYPKIQRDILDKARQGIRV